MKSDPCRSTQIEINQRNYVGYSLFYRLEAIAQSFAMELYGDKQYKGVAINFTLNNNLEH